MRNCLFLVFAIFLLHSCNTNVVATEYKSLNGAVWNKDDVLEFTFSELDTLQQYDIFINVRNDDTFPYSNLFLITALNTQKARCYRTPWNIQWHCRTVLG